MDEFISEKIVQLQAESRRYNEEFHSRPIVGKIEYWPDVLHFMSYGQSLSEGAYSHPVTPREISGALMLGDSVHSKLRWSKDWEPWGNDLKPLRSTVVKVLNELSEAPSPRILDSVAQAHLSSKDNARGETPAEGALAFLSQAYQDHIKDNEKSKTSFISTSCGAGGKSLASLEKGGAGDYFNRLICASRAIRDLSSRKMLSYGIGGLLFIGGESDERGTDRGYVDGKKWKNKFYKFIDDFCSDIVSESDFVGQFLPIFMTQTGAGYARDKSTVSFAQADISNEAESVFLVGPYYYLQMVSGHLTANSSRWLGHQFGKVMCRVLLEGRDWRPLQPLRMLTQGAEALIGWHVPVPPLVFDCPFSGMSRLDLPEKGFTARDSRGGVAISVVEIIADTVVRLRFEREVDPSTLEVTYAGERTGGRGCLRDSDPTLATETWLYDPASGQSPEENVPDFLNKKFPLYNWAIRCRISVRGQLGV